MRKRGGLGAQHVVIGDGLTQKVLRGATTSLNKIEKATRLSVQARLPLFYL